MRSIKVEKIKVLIMQLVLLVAILVLWEVLANKGVIITFYLVNHRNIRLVYEIYGKWKTLDTYKDFCV
ncbi:MAG: hypothetical protein ACLTG7_11765 [Romboutsia sp.]